MTKNDIAKALCQRNPNLSKSLALQVADEVFTILAGAFEAGDNVYLRGFGTFRLVTSKAKIARNIAKGTPVVVPARRTVKFRPCNKLKNRLNP